MLLVEVRWKGSVWTSGLATQKQRSSRRSKNTHARCSASSSLQKAAVRWAAGPEALLTPAWAPSAAFHRRQGVFLVVCCLPFRPAFERFRRRWRLTWLAGRLLGAVGSRLVFRFFFFCSTVFFCCFFFVFFRSFSPLFSHRRREWVSACVRPRVLDWIGCNQFSARCP